MKVNPVTVFNLKSLLNLFCLEKAFEKQNTFYWAKISVQMLELAHF